MELKDLSKEGKIASISLFNLLVVADGTGSPEEAKHVAHLAHAFGEDEYRSLLDEANSLGSSEDEVKAIVGQVTSQEEREMIYGNVMDCAFEDGLQANESKFLDWLAKEWTIKVQIIEE